MIASEKNCLIINCQWTEAFITNKRLSQGWYPDSSERWAALGYVTETWRRCRNSQRGETVDAQDRTVWVREAHGDLFICSQGLWGQCVVVLLMLKALGIKLMFNNVWRNGLSWNGEGVSVHHQLIYRVKHVGCLYYCVCTSIIIICASIIVFVHTNNYYQVIALLAFKLDLIDCQSLCVCVCACVWMCICV